jgi:hypothetical protein
MMRAESKELNPTEEAMLTNMNKLMLVAKMVGAARNLKERRAAEDMKGPSVADDN